jgi:nitrite reductase/ring-hydroxylating ferredoxin subunit
VVVSRRSFLSFLAISFSVLLALSLAACEPGVRKRPVGWMRVGPVKDFLQPEVFLPDKRLMVRRDEGGFYAMSTACTYDLTALRRVLVQNGYIFVSERTGAKYTASGEIIEGPQREPLPYYELRLDALVHGGPIDTLYVRIGSEKPADWRLR